jgi:hypothetical protein
MIWVAKHRQFHPDMLGYIPQFLSDRDPRPAKEQLNTNYQSGWDAQPGFTMLSNGNLSYPGDPPLQLLAETRLRDEVIRFYDCEYVAIVQPDGSFEACRMD